jgi:TetR/AcrR family transcriptional regulator, fatty acid metabolism regulator protein
MRTKEGNKEQAIFDAAVEVFAERGYHNAKISTIADRAGIATGSVYLYFNNKESIILTIFDRLWERVLAGISVTVARTDLDPQQKLNSIIDTVFDFFISNPALATVFVNEQHHLIKDGRGNVAEQYDRFLDIAEKVLHDGVKNGLFSKNVDVSLFRHFVTGGLRNMLRQWASNPTAIPLDRVRQTLKYVIIHGILRT